MPSWIHADTPRRQAISPALERREVLAAGVSHGVQNGAYRRDLEASIQDELSDVAFYAGIANEAPTEELRLIVTSIVGDEYAHARTQAALLGMNPPPPSPPLPPTQLMGFTADVMRAVQGETDAVSRYADLAARAPSIAIRYILTSIMGDEYGHIRIWEAMLHTL